MDKYIAFDVETPNARSNRMSAIGIAVIENKKITEKFFSLVNPETYFSSFNTALTGITPQSVKTAPTFPKLWKKIEPLMTGGILIAHNAAFDMRVPATGLKDYGITTERYKKYACTVQLGRKCYPNLPDHKLKEPLIKSRPTDLVLILLVFFRQIALKILEIRQYSCGFFEQFA